MFERIFSAIGSKANTQLCADDSCLALGGLLVRIAKSDQHYAFEEIGQIDGILAERYQLNAVQAAKMRAECEQFEAQAPTSDDFALALKDSVAYSERSAIVEALWKVVMADGVEQTEEHSLFVKTANILGVDPTDLIRSKTD
ncbi:tellurite resistance TerB family protein [Cochlodiniinecator piscidefendens]|uniref:tellurite resistance TerB family protein n=1 Tax=Cochlodiniinecator piscidefendens TaxID=2715756 RepID=UPI00140B0182|nr:TerB family tellurite resistance protein [Cochlodiniinecator piscidefendens]